MFHTPTKIYLCLPTHKTKTVSCKHLELGSIKIKLLINFNSLKLNHSNCRYRSEFDTQFYHNARMRKNGNISFLMSDNCCCLV